MVSSTLLLQAVVALAGTAAAAPYHMFPRVIVPQEYYEVLNLRASTDVNPAAVTGVTCTDASR
jgi:hypothetical protein